jgi:hypothetical protein
MAGRVLTGSAGPRGGEDSTDVDADHPERNSHWDVGQRHETTTERLDRNWSSLLQELRVVQTGVQLLTGFLLTLPFQQRFGALGDPMRVLYLATVSCSVAATVLLVAPVAMHRILFRQRRLKVLVSAAHRCAYAGLLLLGLALAGVTVVVFDAVFAGAVAVVAGICAVLAFATFWLGLPLMMRLRTHPQPTRDAAAHR